MSRPENVMIATLDDANAAQQMIRAAMRRLIERWSAEDIEIVIRATQRTQDYLKELRRLEHERA